jgi:subtilisin family serine protease
MNDSCDIFKVPWNSRAWERAILERTDIARAGGRRDWVLYRPGRLLVRASALRDKRVSAALKRAGADRSDARIAEVARTFGFALLIVPDDKLVRLVRRIESWVPSSAQLDHVQLPGPNRIHGDDLPKPTTGPLAIPGAGNGGEGLTVLVLDTGFADPPPFVVTTTPADAEVPDEDHDKQRDPAAGHGTHVAGIIASIAPGASIVARRLLTSPVGEASDLDVAMALAKHGDADIINCSFGATTLLDAPPPPFIGDVLKTLPDSTVVVAAAGNEGVDRLSYPAAFEGVVAVGAVGSPENDGQWQQTDFSNWGPWVDCCAPGVAIASTFIDRADLGFEGYATWTGTSMAAPAVTGAIAALATKSKISVQEAAAQLLKRPKLGQVGALIDPANI